MPDTTTTETNPETVDTATDTSPDATVDTSAEVTDDDIDDDEDYDTEPANQLVFSSFGSVTINNNSMVEVPADRAADFGRAATYFSAHTNRHTMTVDLGSTDAAKLFCKQLNSYASNHNLSTSPKREESRVTFRFAAKRDASKPANGEVTVTKQEPTVKPASELKIPTPASVPAQRKTNRK